MTADAETSVDPRHPPRWTEILRRGRRMDLVVVIGMIAAAQLGFFLAGVRWIGDVDAAASSWQVLDPALLVHDFFRSLFYLHSQPPLFNIEIAVFALIGGHAAEIVMALVNLALAFVLGLFSYLAALELGIRRSVALLLLALLEASPAVVLYQNWPYETYPTAASFAILAYCSARFYNSGRTRHCAGMFVVAAAIVLGNSTFQLPWLLALFAVALVARRASWRQILRCGLIPLVLVFGWYLKNAVLFGTYSTSSWLGMNLSKVTLRTAPESTLEHLVHTRVLTPLALVSGFQPASAYGGYVALPHTGVPALDENMKQNAALGPNLNNLAIIKLSSDYLHDDLAFIAHDPRSYATSIASAFRLWFVPSDQYFFVQTNRNEILNFSNGFDRVVALEPQLYGDLGVAPSWSQVSFTSLVTYLFGIVGTPLVYLLLRRRRPRRSFAPLWVLWVTVVYATLLTALVEFGENNRFRFEIGPLPWLLAAGLFAVLWQAAATQPQQEALESGGPEGASAVAATLLDGPAGSR